MNRKVITSDSSILLFAVTVYISSQKEGTGLNYFRYPVCG